MKLNKFLLAVSLSIALLAGLWQVFVVLYPNTLFPLYGMGVAGFLGWATFYAAGGKKEGLIKGIPANLSGVFWAFIIAYLWVALFGLSVWGAFVAVAIGAGMMCFQAHLKIFSFIPGAFIGCSTYFANFALTDVGFDYALAAYGTIAGLLAGLVLGYISEVFAGYINSKLAK